jgi:hypothetical protein
LRQIVADYESRGIDLSTDPRLAEAILLDSFPDAPAEVRALVEAIRSGAIQYMRDRAGQGAEFSIHGSASQLEDSAGLREDLARWSVETWWNALALGPAAGAGAVEAAKATRPVPPPPPPPPAGAVPAQPDQPAASEDVTAYSTAVPLEPPPTAGQPHAEAGQPVHDTGQQFHDTGQQFPAAPPEYPTGQPSYETDRQPWETTPQHYPAEQHGYQSGPPPYASGPQGPPPGQGPVPPGPSGGKARNTRVLVLVGVVVLVLVGYAAVASAAHLPPFKAAGTTTTSSIPVVTSTTPTTSSTTTTSSTPTPTTSSVLSQQLFSAIPNASTTCVALTAAELTARVPAGAGAAWQCSPTSGGISVLYAIFGSNAAAQTGYNGTITRVTGGTLPSGLCGTHNNVEGTYHANSNPGTTIGSLACYTTGGTQILFWWHYKDHILASASSTTLGVAAMMKDWASLGPS